MARRYHINPDTGASGRCEATSGNCPFGDENQHFSTARDARAAYEKQMVELAEYREGPLGQLDAKMDKFIQSAKEKIVKVVEWMDDNPLWVIAGLTTVGAVVLGIVGHRIAASLMENVVSKPVDGVLTDPDVSRRIIGVLGKGGFIKTTTTYEAITADGVFPYSIRGNVPIESGTSVPLHLYSNGTLHDIAADDGGIAKEILTGTTGGAGIGAGAGLVSGFFATMGVARLAEYLDAKWNMRHEHRFGLTNWR